MGLAIVAVAVEVVGVVVAVVVITVNLVTRMVVDMVAVIAEVVAEGMVGALRMVVTEAETATEIAVRAGGEMHHPCNLMDHHSFSFSF